MREEEIIAQIAEGREEALKKLILMYNSRLFSYAYGLLQNYEDAEEAVAETFFQVWRSARNFKGGSKVSTWLFGVCRNVIRNMLRKKMKELKTLELMERDAVSEELPIPEDVHMVRRALEALPPTHREVLHLVFYEELPYEEVAKVLGIPLNTVKTRVFYAKRRLLEAIKEVSGEGYKGGL
jgi:RNA polymerase sigma-70 factor (ECF subfamily)